MRHQVKKVKIGKGRDANKALLKKLSFNLIRDGSIETTLTRAKLLKSFMDRLLHKSKNKTESNKNYLLRYFSPKIVTKLFDEIGPKINDITGGYIKVNKMFSSRLDSAKMARVSFVFEIESKTKKDKKVKSDKKNPTK